MGSGQHTHLIAAVFGIHRCPADAVPEVDRNILAVGSLGEWGLIAVLRRCALRIKSHEALACCRIKLLDVQNNRLGPRAAEDAHPTRVAHGRAGLRVGSSRARIGKNIQDRRSETRGRGCKQEQERAVRRHYWLVVVSAVEARQSTRTSAGPAQHTFRPFQHFAITGTSSKKMRSPLHVHHLSKHTGKGAVPGWGRKESASEAHRISA